MMNASSYKISVLQKNGEYTYTVLYTKQKVQRLALLQKGLTIACVHIVIVTQ